MAQEIPPEQAENQEYAIRKGLVTSGRTPEDINNGVSKDPAYLRKKAPDFVE